jgi:hypothetical protein
MSEGKVLPPAGHEESDIGSWFIWCAFLFLLGSLAVLVFGVLWLFPLSTTDRTLRLPLQAYPAPQLQPSPRMDMARFYAQEMQALNSFGWVDRTHGVVHIPIAEAMRKVAEEGIPGWPARQEAQR